MNRYAVSDLHGQLDLYNQIKEYINNDDVLYVLGDCNDRGPHPWATLRSALDDGQCCLLMGNHEYMLLNAIEYALNNMPGGIDALRDEDFFWYNPSGHLDPITLLEHNGGMTTLLQWAREQKYLEYYEKIKHLPTVTILLSNKSQNCIYLSHAGYNPTDIDSSIEEFVWNRHHYMYTSEDFNEGDIMVHGHTPVPYLVEELQWRHKSYSLTNDGLGCCIYNNGFKYDIDLGAYHTGRTCLLNLDTLETKIFETEVVDEY